MRATKFCKSMSAVAALLAGVSAFGVTPGRAAPPPEPMPDFGAALPAADLQEGQHESYKCMECHDLTNARANQFGPPLWNVVGRARATAPGFHYSGVMRASHAPWTFERLFVYLRNPQAYVPGTPMSFTGIRNPKYRINVIAWLRNNSDHPVPIPAPKIAGK